MCIFLLPPFLLRSRWFTLCRSWSCGSGSYDSDENAARVFDPGSCLRICLSGNSDKPWKSLERPYTACSKVLELPQAVSGSQLQQMRGLSQDWRHRPGDNCRQFVTRSRFEAQGLIPRRPGKQGLRGMSHCASQWKVHLHGSKVRA